MHELLLRVYPYKQEIQVVPFYLAQFVIVTGGHPVAS